MDEVTRMGRREFNLAAVGALAALGAQGGETMAEEAMGEVKADGKRPNILWLVAEDTCLELRCYGHPLVRTPHLDALARQGTRYTQAFSTAPVCSATRSAFHTGMYQTTIDAHQHRSHRDDGYRLPDGVRLVSERLRDAGYYVTNGSYLGGDALRPGKTDFNFDVDAPFDGADWRECPPDRPFFAQVCFLESHRGRPWQEVQERPRTIDPADVTLPAYYPDHPTFREDVATYLEVMGLLDEKVGAVLGWLEERGLAENTLVFSFSDHGRCLLRGKQWMYDAGIHVPLIVRWPGHVEADAACDDLVSLIDVAAATLEAAGVALPEDMAGVPFLSPDAPKRACVFAARDRCDETRDRIRCVRTARWKYIRNYMPERPYTQQNRYIESSYPPLAVWKELHAAGKLTPEQALFMAERKPDEELYDVQADPDEVRNLAGDPAHADTLAAMRQRLDAWLEETDDRGRHPEAVTAIHDEYGLPVDTYK